MKSLTIFVSAAIILLCGCEIGFGPGIQDFEAKLPGGCYIWRSSAHQISIKGSIEIPVKVLELDHDDSFLIVKQQDLQPRSPQDLYDGYMEPKPDAFHFWIANLKTHDVYGPLTTEEFDRKRKDLGVPGELRMRDVYTFDPRNR